MRGVAPGAGPQGVANAPGVLLVQAGLVVQSGEGRSDCSRQARQTALSSGPNAEVSVADVSLASDGQDPALPIGVRFGACMPSPATHTILKVLKA